MRAIIWKQARELLRWAVLGMVVLGMFVGVALTEWYDDTLSRPPVMTRLPLHTEGILLAFSLGMIGIGLWLGKLTGYRARGTEWALLIHRPVSRTRIFAGMSVAMLGLYVAAMGIPLAGVIAVVHWIKPRGPFAWGTALAAVMAVLVGIPLLFGGMLIMQRRAKWYGSMWLPAAFMLAVSVYAAKRPEFWHGVLWVFGGTVVLVVAAWGVFVSGGDEEKQPVVVKAAQGITLSVGLLYGVLIGGLMLVLFAQYVTDYPFMKDGPIAFTGTPTDYRLTADGQLVIEKHEVGKPGRTWTDLQGQALLLEDSSRSKRTVTMLEGSGDDRIAQLEDSDTDGDHSATTQLITSPASQPTAGKLLDNDAFVWLAQGSDRKGGYQEQRAYVRWFFTEGRVEVWWVYEAALGRVVGYRWPEWTRVGSIGPEGFAEDGAEPKSRFRGRMLSNPNVMGKDLWLCLSSGVYQLDAEQRQMRPVYEARPGQEIVQVGNRAALPHHLVIQTDKTLELVGREEKFGNVVLPLLEDQADYRYIGIAPIDGGRKLAVHYTRSSYYSDQLRDGCVLIYDAATGQLVQRQDIPEQRRGVPMVAGFAVFEPSFGIGTLIWAVAWKGCEFDLKSMLWQFEVLGAAAVVFCLVNVVVAWRWALGGRRMAWWGVLGLVMGLAGVLLLWCMVSRPVKVRCASCGRKRVVRRERCEHCAAEFGRPAENGTEVFA
ncbi:MAG: hypothetical protein IT443_05225 [Phycisphaeraceae bacterium]|nr:hypothetical protein [Phycisphaeraceae bacterium]